MAAYAIVIASDNPSSAALSAAGPIATGLGATAGSIVGYEGTSTNTPSQGPLEHLRSTVQVMPTIGSNILVLQLVGAW